MAYAANTFADAGAGVMRVTRNAQVTLVYPVSASVANGGVTTTTTGPTWGEPAGAGGLWPRGNG